MTAVAAIQEPRDRANDWRKRTLLLLLLLAAMLLCLGAWWMLYFASPSSNFIAAPLRSILAANYGVDPLGTPVAALNLNLVSDIIHDQTSTPGVDRQATLSSALQTPVAMVTQQPGQASASPTASPTRPATSSPTRTQSPTLLVAYAKPTGTETPPPSATRSSPPTNSHLPPSNTPVPPSNTQVPHPSHTPKPSHTPEPSDTPRPSHTPNPSHMPH
jgi:hypothetical protein